MEMADDHMEGSTCILATRPGPIRTSYNVEPAMESLITPGGTSHDMDTYEIVQL
jgi:hypothetical protein